MEGSLDIAGLLLDNGADIDYVDTDCRSSLYMMALENDVKTGENQSELSYTLNCSIKIEYFNILANLNLVFLSNDQSEFNIFIN